MSVKFLPDHRDTWGSEITLTHPVTLNPWTQAVDVYVINTHKGNPANLSHQWAKQDTMHETKAVQTMHAFTSA